MRFIKIELSNYRPYRGRCQIEFPEPKSHKNFYIIMGKNGTGKTSILNAIHWCLYDEEAEKKTGGLLNNSIASEMNVNDFKEVKVDLYLQDDEDDLIYWVSRSKQYQKTKDGLLFGLDSRLKISISKKSGGGFVENPFPEAVASIIPAGIKRFFIFNGEELKSFFGLNGPKEVYDAVLDVSQIDLLTKTLSHLSSINAEEAKDVSGSSEADNLSKQLANKTQEITEQTEKIRKKSGEIEQNRIKLNELRDFLKKSNSEVIKERQARREAQTAELGRITKEIDDLEMTRTDLVIKNLPFIYLNSSLKKADSIFSTMVDKGTIPPDINSDFIKELLKKHECICGAKFKSDSKEDKALHILLHKWESYNEYAETFIDLRPKVSDSLVSNKNVAKELRSVGKKIIDYEKDENKISRILESLKPASSESNANELIRKEREEIALAQAIETESRYLGADDQTLKQLEKEKAAINAQIDKILDKEVKDKYTKFRIDMYKEATNLIDSIKNDIIEEVQKGIEERTNKYFMQMIWKKDTYKKIGISKEYNISVLDKYGTERVGNMSAGEEQILAFSFMAALKEISVFESCPISYIAAILDSNAFLT